MNKFILIIYASFLLASCTGGGGGSEKDPKAKGAKDTTPPVITLNGKDKVLVTKGSSYKESGAKAEDNLDGPTKVVITGSVDTSTLGTYKIKYSSKDKEGNTSKIFRAVIVEAKDTTPPVITLNGKDKVLVTKGSSYKESGAKAEDNLDGPTKVVITGSVDTSILGTYKIKYSSKDKEGNTSEIFRTVVVEAKDTTPPVITLNGKDKVFVTMGSSYKESGAKAEDNLDGSTKVVITGSVDTSTLGTYKIKYSSRDNEGNTSEIFRTVVVETWYNDLFSYKQSAHTKSLKKCVSATAAFSCTMLKLPLIGQETNNPTSSDIMNRVIVSHKWMGDRFEKVLAQLPDDIKLLFRSVTAIVIDDDIRPSFYSMGTGAIYLDPASFWLSNEEKEDIAKEEDYRASYGNDLAFLELWGYTKNQQYLYKSKGALNNDIERGLEDIVPQLAHLLYHELAHAGDFAPIQDIAGLDKADSIYNVLYAHWNAGQGLSWKLHLHSQLHSSNLSSLAQVRFSGEKATADEKKMQADYVGSLFANDGAVTHYNYSSLYEDFANLFMASMMKKHYNADIDQAFIYKPKDAKQCSDYIVGWGTRNRISNPLVTNRAKFVAESILPETNWNDFFQFGIGTETLKVSGKDWCENLGFSNQKSNMQARGGAQNYGVDLKQLTRSPNESFSR